jgi:PAS domain S-box-containing protein
MFPLRQNYCADVAPCAQLLMLKTSPDRFDHSSGSACRPTVFTIGAHVTPFVGQVGNLKRQRASEAAGFAAMAIAAAALIGWRAGLPLLSIWGSGYSAIGPFAVLMLAAFGLALVHPGKDSRFAFALGLAGIACAAVGLVVVLFDIELGIDRWLAPRAPLAGSFRVTSAGMLAFGLAAGALALSRFERQRLAATVLASIAGGITVFALLGYLSGVDTLYGSASVNSPSLPAAVGLLCVAVGIILRIGTMPVLHRSRPLWHLLVMLGCSIVAPLLLFGAYAGFRIADAQFDQVRDDLLSEARALSVNVDREIIGEIERLQALAASPSLRQGDFAEFQSQAEAALALLQSGNIVLIDRYMQELVNTWVPFGTHLGKAAVSESLVERSLATGKPQVAGLFIGSVTKRLMFSIIVPVQIDGENRYALARSPDLHPFVGLVAPNRLQTGWQAVVSDATHRIIARSDRPDAFVGRELSPSQWHRAGPEGVFEFSDTEGRPSLEAYTRSELTGWEAVVWAPKAALEAPVRVQWRTLGAIALLAIALVAASAFWLGRTITRSVGHAARTAVALGEGGPMPVSGTPVAEVDTLMAELRGAATRRQAAEHDLQASKDQLQLAFDATKLGWWRYDPLRGVAWGDARFDEIFEVTAGEIAIEDLMKRVHPDDVERFRANGQAVLDPVNPTQYVHHEYLVRRRDGTVRWVEANALAYFEGAGAERRAVSLGGTVQDITERKEREEKEHLLMREVNHRAKNMLSVVDAIAHQTAARNAEGFVERFSERIQALSANQDLLIRNEWKGVDIADLVRAQLAHFADLIGSRIAVHGPKRCLKAASAQAIGLALHELATNAGKYGALSTDTGRLDISWRTEGDTFTMNWTESEGPPVSPPKRRGFGSIVMELMAERSVDGAVDLDYAPSGVTWRLTCPAASALEPR